MFFLENFSYSQLNSTIRPIPKKIVDRIVMIAFKMMATIIHTTNIASFSIDFPPFAKCTLLLLYTNKIHMKIAIIPNGK